MALAMQVAYFASIVTTESDEGIFKEVLFVWRLARHENNVALPKRRCLNVATCDLCAYTRINVDGPSRYAFENLKCQRLSKVNLSLARHKAVWSGMAAFREKAHVLEDFNARTKTHTAV